MMKHYLKTPKLGLMALLLLFGLPGRTQLLAMVQQVKTDEPAKNAARRQLSDVLRELKNHYRADILFEPKTVEGISVLAESINKNLSLEQNLENLLRPAGLKFKKINRTSYTVSADKSVKSGGRTDARFPQTTEAETPEREQISRKSLTENEPVSLKSIPVDKTVVGAVTDESGSGLPGVSILVKGTQRGTTTDAGGKYKIEVLDGSAVLVFSFVGYLSQELAVGNQSQINVSLKVDTKALEEVVVVGYGTQRKIATTGSIASVKSTELKQTPIVNVAQGLQARASGVQITQNSGAPGGNISVRIRGTNSINGTSEPLYIIDGIQVDGGGSSITGVSPLSSINPNDIESVEVLKDASSTAIYGSRAANGVVLITTKKGKEGTTNVNYESYYGIQQVSKKLDLLNGQQFAELENEIYKRTQLPNPESYGKGTDWQSIIFRDAPIQNHQISVTGGNAKTQFAMSGNYFNQKGIVLNSDYSRYSIRMNLDHRINSFAKVGMNIYGTYQTSSQISRDDEVISFTPRSVVTSALFAPPVLKPYNEDGSIYSFRDQFGGLYAESVNPLISLSPLNINTTRRTMASIYGEFAITKKLIYKSTFNADTPTGLTDYYFSKSAASSSGFFGVVGGRATKTNTNFLNLLHESILTYNTGFNENHKIGITGVFGYQIQTGNSNTIEASNFPNDITQNEAVQLAALRTVSSNRFKNNLESYMLRTNYGFRDKYFLDATIRLDGSSKFGVNNKYGFFPAVSAAWRITEEPFMKNVGFISDFKLRASYGITGNAGAISEYQSLATVAAYGNGYSFNHSQQIGIAPTRVPNPDLRWERSAQADIGFDISLLNNRFSFVFDWYNKQTDGLLYTMAIPMASGYSSITGNFAKLENKGLEFATNVKILTGILKWDVSGNISFNRNKLLKLDGNLTEVLIGNRSLLKIGEPIGVYKAYIFEGVYQTGEAILPGSNSRIGGPKLKDINADGKIDANDLTIIGNPHPNYIFGVSSNLSYKNFDLGALVQGIQGNKVYNAIGQTLETPFGGRNLLSGVANRWTPTNPSNEFVNALQAQVFPNTSRHMEDGSFVRLKNLTLGYTLTKIKGINNIRFYLSGNNLFILTNYSGFDPEVNVYANSNTQLGVDLATYPQAKSYLMGLQINF